MIKTDELRGVIAKNGYSQKDVAEKMNKGVFGSDEIEIMIDKLGIDNPVAIFFAHK